MKAPTSEKKQNEAVQDGKLDHVTPSEQRHEQKMTEVQHQSQPQPPTSAAPVATTKGGATSGAILENAAASVSSALESAKEVISKD
ncbi:hypothetical protein R6Q59_005681 [Mikania micrantha]